MSLAPPCYLCHTQLVLLVALDSLVKPCCLVSEQPWPVPVTCIPVFPVPQVRDCLPDCTAPHMPQARQLLLLTGLLLPELVSSVGGTASDLAVNVDDTSVTGSH